MGIDGDDVNAIIKALQLDVGFVHQYMDVAYKVTAVLVGGHRVAPEVEELGLDLPEMGALAYPDSPEVASAVILSEPADVSLGGGLEPATEAA